MAGEKSTIGALFQVGDGATPTEAFSTIGGVTAVPSIGGGSTNDIDVTALEDLSQRFIKGYKDNGEVSIPFNPQSANTLQQQLKADADASTNIDRNYQITDPTGATTYITFTGYVKDVEISGSAGDAFRGTATLKLQAVPAFPILN